MTQKSSTRMCTSVRGKYCFSLCFVKMNPWGISKAVISCDFGGVLVVKVNGEMKDIAGKKVSEYLLTTRYDFKRIAVERNGEIVLKSQYDSTVFVDGDTVEIVSFVGGG